MSAGTILLGVILFLVGMYLLVTAFLPQIIGIGIVKSTPILDLFSQFIVPEVSTAQVVKGVIGLFLMLTGLGIAGWKSKQKIQQY